MRASSLTQVIAWPARLVVAGLGLGKVEGSREYPACDERVPLETVLRWAETQSVPVVTVPGTDHFFSRKLSVLCRFVCAHLSSVSGSRPA